MKQNPKVLYMCEYHSKQKEPESYALTNNQTTQAASTKIIASVIIHKGETLEELNDIVVHHQRQASNWEKYTGKNFKTLLHKNNIYHCQNG